MSLVWQIIIYTVLLLGAAGLWEIWREHQRRKKAIRKLVARIMEWRSEPQRKASVIEGKDVI